MKIKGPAILTLFVVLLLSAVRPLPLDAKIAVTDVEYLKGKNFVQLHFVMNKIIPIPELKYPQEPDRRFILMTIPDVDLQKSEGVLTFPSPIIDKVKLKKKSQYLAVEIKLKEEVNYRIFSNMKGLYVEFPVVRKVQNNTPPIEDREILARNKVKKDIPPRARPSQTKEKELKLPNPNFDGVENSKKQRKNNKEKKSVLAQNKPPKRKKHAPVIVDDGTPKSITAFNIVEKKANRVKFEFKLSGPVNYNVIPIPDAPSRLAIDFKNTRSNRIKQNIDFLNVKKVRGAYNTPTVYRVVFDLLYLKNYNVSCKDNVMVVEFLNQTTEKRNYAKNNSNIKHTKNNKPTVKKRNFENSINASNTNNKNLKKESVGVNKRNTKNKEASPVTTPKKTTQAKADLKLNNRVSEKKNNSKSAPAQKKVTDRKKNLEKKEKTVNNEIILGDNQAQTHKKKNTNVSPKKRKQIREITFSGPGPYNIDDFFPDEQSKVAAQKLNFSTDPDESAIDGEGNTSQISYLRKTIETGRREYTGEPMNFFFKNADLDNVILFFAKVSGLSIVIDPGVSGTVTARMYQVPWDQALSYFLKTNGLDMVLEGNLLRIGRVDALATEAKQRRVLKESREMQEDLEVISRTLSYSKVAEMAPLLKKQLSQRGEILMDNRSNTLIISEIPDRIERLDKLIDTLDVANRQVSIEARIVETNSNYTESLGIQWGYGFTADAMYGNQTSLKFPSSVSVDGAILTSDAFTNGPLGGYAVNLPASGANTGTVFSLANVANTFRLDVALSAMEQSGNGRIISSPKTTTQNNMAASIMQGKQIPVQTIQNNTVTVKYVNAMLELNVTPQITAKGTVIVDIDIKNNAADFGNLVNQIPPIITQSIKTTVMVNDGGTVVIGGMYKVEDSVSKAGTPFFSKIPLLGNLFKNSSKRREQKELLIFITPRIIK